jgi:hypothetical protein
MVLNFPTPAVRRREKAKNRTFEIIQSEFKERVKAMQADIEVEDDVMSAALGGVLDEEMLHCGDEQRISAAIKKVVLNIYGLIWGVRLFFASVHVTSLRSDISAGTFKHLVICYRCIL